MPGTDADRRCSGAGWVRWRHWWNVWPSETRPSFPVVPYSARPGSAASDWAKLQARTSSHTSAPLPRNPRSESSPPGAPVPGLRRADARVALLWGAAAVLAAAVVGVAVHKAWPVLFPKIAERAPLSPSCDLRGAACTARFAGGGSVRLDIRPRGIPTAQPLDVDVRLEDLPTPARVELDFAGVDMDMGYNRASLDPSPEASGHYTGGAMLPVCVRERMTWEARILLHFPDGTMAAPFRFETARPGAAVAPRDRVAR